MKPKSFKIVSIVLTATIFIGITCGCREQLDVDYSTNQESPEEKFYNGENAYPIVRSIHPNANEDAYPAGIPIDQIEDSPTIIVQGPDFWINKPVISGDEIISGTGSEYVPIILIDLTSVDEIIGETTIGSDGNFIFELTKPLLSGQSIGIKLGDISGTRFNENEFVYNESYYSRPYVGILFDIAYVE